VLVGELGDHEVVLVFDSLGNADGAEPGVVAVVVIAGERLTVDRLMVVVVVDRNLGIARREPRGDTGVVFEAVRASVKGPELDVSTSCRGSRDGVAGHAVEGPGPSEDARLSDEDLVGGGRGGRTLDVPVAQVGQPVAGRRMGARRHGKRNLQLYI